MPHRVSFVIALNTLGLLACCCPPFNAPKANPPANQQAKGSQKSMLNRELIDKYSLSDKDFESLQYYLAADLVLTREVSKEELSRGTKKGKLVQSKGQTIEEVSISASTPGVCVLLEKDRRGAVSLGLSFEEGTRIGFSKADGNSYTATTLDDGKEATVVFAGNRYKVSRAAINAAYVVVAEESLDNFQRQRKELKGVKVPQ